MPVELYRNARHQCLMFTDTSADSGEAVPANQFLIVDQDSGAIIDPGGNLAYNELSLAIGRYMPPQRLAALIASHADPDIIASLDRWMTASSAPLYISKVWERFVPHFCKPGKTTSRVIPIPDAGMRIQIGSSELIALPAHFLHAEGNFQFFDPISHILFSGDLGASFGVDPAVPIRALAPHIPRMEAFHRRYMVSGKVLKLWAQMVKQLEIDMIVPQHGAPMAGQAVGEFIAWVSTLECGIDLLNQSNYALPTA